MVEGRGKRIRWCIIVGGARNETCGRGSMIGGRGKMTWCCGVVGGARSEVFVRVWRVEGGGWGE